MACGTHAAAKEKGLVRLEGKDYVVQDGDIMLFRFCLLYTSKEASGDEHLKGMGTTVVAATVKEQMLYFANVGDSRLYLINQGIQQPVSYTHLMNSRR